MRDRNFILFDGTQPFDRTMNFVIVTVIVIENAFVQAMKSEPIYLNCNMKHATC